MIGLVIVSHSSTLAEGVCELVRQISQGSVRVAAAGGAAGPDNALGTDAFKVLQAVESVYSEEGVLVLMDLGSAVLSAETALDLMDQERRGRVRLCAAPLVEGAVAAAGLAAAGADLDEILGEARRALIAKESQLAGGTTEPPPPAAAETAAEPEQALVTVPNALGLHARPAAQLVRLARRFQARLTIENLTRAAGPVSATGINGLLNLGARHGDQLRLRAQGLDSREALACLRAFLEGGCGESREAPAGPPSRPVRAAPPAPGRLAGLPASSGVAMGPLLKLRSRPVQISPRHASDPAAEHRRLLDALSRARRQTRALHDWAKTHAGEPEAGIFDAQLLLLEDEALIESASRAILEQRLCAEFAWQAAAERVTARLRSLDDPYLRARAADVADAAARVLRSLTGARAEMPPVSEPVVVAAPDLAPSEVKELNRQLVLGICLEAGSPSAHSVILARSMGIPAVVGLGPGLSALADGTVIALDGDQGVVWVAPEPGVSRAVEGRRQAWLAARQQAYARRKAPAVTSDGRRIRVLANIGSVAEAAEALESGAEGVGVLRTEFLFLGRPEAPSEQEQVAAYRAIAETLGGRPLAIRTLDIGGDKSLPYLDTGAEANPFLGWRGIRVTLSRRDLLRTQLRAILRAGAGYPVEVLFPMVCSAAELREAKAVLWEVEADLEAEGLPFHRGIRVGVMIEAPAAVAVADQLARLAGFFSIGTNDLVQYAMAADRTNPRVASLADPLHPAVLRLIGQALKAGRQAGIGVTLCGELAADTLATPLLIGLGLDEFSVSPPLIPGLKHAIARGRLSQAETLAQQALALESAEAVRQLLTAALEAPPRT